MLYGSERCDLTTMHYIEQVQIGACKRLSKIGMEACNLSVLGDTCRYPVHSMSSTKVIKYWIQITKLPHNVYVKLNYNMLMYYDNIGYTNWLTCVLLNL